MLQLSEVEETMVGDSSPTQPTGSVGRTRFRIISNVSLAGRSFRPAFSFPRFLVQDVLLHHRVIEKCLFAIEFNTFFG